MVPTESALALRTLATIGPLIRLASVIGFLWAAKSARGGAWAAVYQRLAIGMGLAFVVLIGLSVAAVHGRYQTGSWGDIGWMLPFWFAASAAAIAPASQPEPRRAFIGAPQREHATLLFVAVTVVPIVGYGARYLLPLGDPIDEYRDAATAFTMVCGIALVMVRMRIEQRAVEHANEGVRLLAAACEQTAELIVIIRRTAIEYANDAFCRATGYNLEELEVRDLTEDLSMREQLVRSERLSAIGELVSGVAHELNNPLQVVIGTLDLTLLANPSAASPDLERVRAQALRAGKIVRNLLAFVRKSPQERILCDLNEIVQATVALRAYELGAANIRLREQYATVLPLVLANREEIQQIVLNLILNAEQAIVHARRAGEVVVRTELSPTGTGAMLEIADDGPGVPAEVSGRIFEPFFTTREGGDATGLGLSIAFGIAVSHNGTLELAPSTRGACFRLTLPGAGFPGPALIH
jgi:signal transduction histidine kinase